MSVCRYVANITVFLATILSWSHQQIWGAGDKICCSSVICLTLSASHLYNLCWLCLVCLPPKAPCILPCTCSHMYSTHTPDISLKIQHDSCPIQICCIFKADCNCFVFLHINLNACECFKFQSSHNPTEMGKQVWTWILRSHRELRLKALKAEFKVFFSLLT